MVEVYWFSARTAQYKQQRVMKRRVRKIPLTERIKSYPLDFWLWINEGVMAIDWDEYISVSVILGNVLSGTFVMIAKLYLYTTITDKSSSIFQTDYYQYDQIKQKGLKRSMGSTATRKSLNPLVIGMIQLFLVLLFMSSFINMIIIITSYKTYSLMNSERPNSPSVKEKLLTESSNNVWDHITSLFTFKKTDESFLEDSTADSSGIEIDLLNNKLVYELIVWNPSKFQLILSSSFNALTLAIAWMITDLSVWKILLVVFVINLQLYYVVDKFWVLIKDKQILYQEMFQEYNTKFVKPKTDVLKRDVGIDASKFSRYHGTTIVDQTNPYLQNTKLKVFIIHDINGKPINSVNPEDEDEFTSERKKLESERIRFELEKEKFQNQVNSSVILDVDESWLNSTLTYNKIPSLNSRFDNSNIIPSRYMNNAMDPPKSPSRSPKRPYSQTTPISSRISSPSRSPARSPGHHSPTRSPTRLTSPTRSTQGYSRESPMRSELSFRSFARDERSLRRPFR